MNSTRPSTPGSPILSGPWRMPRRPMLAPICLLLGTGPLAADESPRDTLAVQLIRRIGPAVVPLFTDDGKGRFVRVAAGLHPLRIEFFESTGDAQLKLEVQAPGGERRPVPAEWFFRD